MDFNWKNTRYNRQEAIPNFGVHGQKALQKSTVGIVGAGGVKSPILLYLAAAGVGKIKIIDFDRVELSNLNRQILYTQSDIGLYKSEAAATHLMELNPEIIVEPMVNRLTRDNFEQLFHDCDLVFEGGNSSTEREAFNRAALSSGKIYIHASAQFNYGYVFTVVPTVTPCFECVFDDLPRSHGGPVPIIGTATAIAGSIAASEAINILIGRGPQIINRILFFDGWLNQFIDIPTTQKVGCSGCSPSK